MTREDIDNIISVICPNDEDFEKACISPAYLKKELETLALEQEPCTDAISRQAAIDAIKEYASMIWKNYYEPFPESTIMEIIQVLPPVKPEQKIGRWEWVQYDANPEIGNFHCSECRYIPAAFNLSARRMRYCPNCGAKMQEVEE